MTEQLMAEFEATHGGGGSNPAAGTSGVAYAGGASSSTLSLNRVQSRTPPPNHKDPVGDRVRANDRMSPKEVPQRREQQRTESPQSRSYGSQHNSPQMQDHPAEARGSPQYHTPLGTPGEHPATSYTPYNRRESYQLPPRASTPPAPQRRASGMSPDALSMRATPPAAIQARTPERDRSLPVQEEPEDEHGDRWDNNGRDSRAGHREDDDDDTLIDHEQESERKGTNGNGQNQITSEDEESNTPRSPTGMLPSEDLPIHGALYGANNRLASLSKHYRNGSTDQLGLRSFDPELFDNQPPKKEEVREAPAAPARRDEPPPPRHYVQEPQHHSAPPQYTNNELATDPYAHYGGRLHPPQIPHPEDLHSYFDPSQIFNAYMNSPRPMAPIPPTPISGNTAAPSPSPMISSIQPSPAPPIGSPYPYPFTHVRRSHAYPASPLAASSSYDPNHPSVIQQELALQMQMYAMNNNAPVSESNFSPASTPYPGASYNPWTFLQASRAFGGRQLVDQSPSMHSSPSHEPLSLPMPHLRGRGMKKTKRSSLRKQHNPAMEVPPRVESTQPRDTSPEISSGEETSTAGEADDKYEAQEEGNWVHGREPRDDSADWVDEDDEGEDGDLLDLEYHPQYVKNVEKRRRRWETRWEALTQSVSLALFVPYARH